MEEENRMGQDSVNKINESIFQDKPVDEVIEEEKRLLLSVDLKPIQGDRFQPTGFPNIGPAEYEADSTKMLIVESSQSMANRLEMTCWDFNTNNIIKELNGIPYINVKNGKGKFLTSSILEAHRLASPYILDSYRLGDIAGKERLMGEIVKEELLENGNNAQLEIIEINRLVKLLDKYDFNSLLHGVFLAKKEISGGRYHLQRALTAFVEAKNVKEVISGGTKIDILNAKGEKINGDLDENLDVKKESERGRSNIIYPRMEYTGDITAYFNLNIEQIKNYDICKNEKTLLLVLALFKIKRLLDSGLRFRTACDLKVEGEIKSNIKLKGGDLPSEDYLLNLIKDLINKIKLNNENLGNNFSPFELTYKGSKEK